MRSVVSAILLLVFLPFFASGQPRESVEGQHYQVLENPVVTETDEDVIEVREIFWYGCPECFTLEPLLTEWGESVVGDLKFFRTPAVWNEVMALHAKVYYASVVLNLESKMHQAAFRSLHEENNSLRTVEQVQQLFFQNGVEEAVFNEVWNSQEVEEGVQHAIERTTDYQINKLPTVIVNGRYTISHNDKVDNHTELNIAVNLLVRRLRDERRSDF